MRILFVAAWRPALAGKRPAGRRIETRAFYGPFLRVAAKMPDPDRKVAGEGRVFFGGAGDPQASAVQRQNPAAPQATILPRLKRPSQTKVSATSAAAPAQFRPQASARHRRQATLPDPVRKGLALALCARNRAMPGPTKIERDGIRRSQALTTVRNAFKKSGL